MMNANSEVVPRKSKHVRNNIIAALLVVVVFVLIVVAIVQDRNEKMQTLREAKPVVQISEKDKAEAAAMRTKACSTVERLKNAGAFTKIQPGYSGVTHAYVDHGFFAVPIDAKNQALKAVALCHVSLEKKDQLGIVVVHNGYTGKEIGTFDLASGLDLD